MAAASALIAGAVHATSAAQATDVAAPGKVITNASVGMQMFEWNWTSLTTECTNVLGPEGVDWILVSPPQESIQGTTWWVNYQPVSYKLENNLGTRDQFIAMVNACNAAGVEVIVDAVINHMASGGALNQGTAGSTYSAYNYPAAGYSSADFHATLPSKDPNYCSSARSINYSDPFSITHCQLLGLNDLATEKPSVRATIDAYLNDLLSIGVSGFRIDAARHIGITDLTAIQNGLNLTTGGIKPMWLSENTGDRAANAPFAVTGQVFGWSWLNDMVYFFGYASDLSLAVHVSDSYAGNNGSAQTVTMVSNHDTERNGGALTYQDNQGKTFLQASIYTVVNQYGLPMLYTGYAYSNHDQGPPMVAGKISDASCTGTGPLRSYRDGQYICLDRWTAIKGAIAWKDAVGSSKAAISHGRMGTWSKQYRTYSYKRGAGSFIIFNGGSKSVKNAKIATGLKKGTYCDYITGGSIPLASPGACSGAKVLVDSKGMGTFTIPVSGTIALSDLSKF